MSEYKHCQITFDDSLFHWTSTKYGTWYTEYTQKSTYEPYTNEVRSRHSSVGTVTVLKTDCALQFQTGLTDFSLFQNVHPLSGLLSLLRHSYQGFFLGGKEAEAESQLFTYSSAAVKNDISTFPFAFITCTTAASPLHKLSFITDYIISKS